MQINGLNAINEQAREDGLSAVRHLTSDLIMERILSLGAQPGMRLLDIGCAHGWFVSAAASAGFDAEGIEPDRAIAASAASYGISVRTGFFPDALPSEAKYEVITLNDVLEHLPDPRATLEACRDRLSPGGLLSIAIPHSRGIVFRIALRSRRLGIAGGLFDRLWQVGLPSPHLWFFDEAGLIRMCESADFELQLARRLPSITRSGLWQRAHLDRRASPMTAAAVASAAVTSPILNARWASDITHLIFRAK